jgi:hypothetical protein
LTADAPKPEIGSVVFLPIRVILEANLNTWERRRAALNAGNLLASGRTAA